MRKGLPMRIHLGPVLTGAQARSYWLLVLCWTVANVLFWSWWLAPDHIETAWLYILFTLAFGSLVSFLPSMYLFYVGQMRQPQPVAAPPSLKVALITLCVPTAESL